MAEYKQYKITQDAKSKPKKSMTNKEWQALKGLICFGQFWKTIPQNKKEESNDDRKLYKEPCHIDMADKQREVST